MGTERERDRDIGIGRETRSGRVDRASQTRRGKGARREIGRVREGRRGIGTRAWRRRWRWREGGKYVRKLMLCGREEMIWKGKERG